MKKLLIAILVMLVTTSVFARGGSGFSSGARSFSSSSFSRSSVLSGIGFGGRSSISRSFSGPSARSYGYSYSNPSVTHNTYISHGYSGGGGFMSSFLGSYVGSSMGSRPVVVNGASNAAMLPPPGGYYPQQQSYYSAWDVLEDLLQFIVMIALLGFMIWGGYKVYKAVK